MNIPHGAAAILAFAEKLPTSATKVKEFHGFTEASELLIVCQQLLIRLAPLESDIDAHLGEE